jgi:hypothetical protein
MKRLIVFTLVLLPFIAPAQVLTTPFERSAGKQTATYNECISFYKALDKASPNIAIKEMGMSDAGYPYHVVLYSADGRFDPVKWHQQKKAVLMINNGIHPGEPDGIDASMILLRDIHTGKVKIPANIALCIIPVYNIGGCLNRNSSTRVNQDGPESYGFRGNAQNLDLNRDFIKADSKNARSFAQIFHFIDPDILIDNHVSDGADYQHTMTLLTTQNDKLGADQGNFLNKEFEPLIYKKMQEKGFPVCPYVNFETSNPDVGWIAFYDPPRYSSGYAALFQTIAFVPETHMLKPFADRVRATYALEMSIIEAASTQSAALIKQKAHAREEVIREKSFPMSWEVDSSAYDTITFLGYASGTKTSEVTGMPRLFYDHSKPFTKEVRFYNTFKPLKFIQKPMAYIIPQGWHEVIDRLKINGVQCLPLLKDTIITVETYRIDEYKSSSRPYEKHHRNYDVKISASQQSIRFLKGDYLIPMQQKANRYIMEVLEPLGEDSFFGWNFFDAILQQKEGYSEYRWEDIAALYLREHPELKTKLDAKKQSDPKFAQSASAQLDFVYKNSPWYEAAHMRYPVYRMMEKN